MPQNVLSFDSQMRSLMSGMLIGDLYFVNLSSGDNNSNGLDWSHALRDLTTAQQRASTLNFDHIIVAGAASQAATLALTKKNLHIMGGGFNAKESAYRGAQLTFGAAIQLTLAASSGALGAEIAGFNFIITAASTSQILVDDLGSPGVYIHDCTFRQGTKLNAILLDIESADWTIARSLFYNTCKTIDAAEARLRVSDCYFQSSHTSGLIINISATAGDYATIERCDFNVSGGTTDKAIVLSSNVIYTSIVDCRFHATCSDPITTTTATGHLNVGNFVATLIGSTSTLKGWNAIST
jgi:hypothetical protein